MKIFYPSSIVFSLIYLHGYFQHLLDLLFPCGLLCNFTSIFETIVSTMVFYSSFETPAFEFQQLNLTCCLLKFYFFYLLATEAVDRVGL